MPYAASCSRTADTRLALDEVCREVASQLQGAAPDVSFLFASRDHVAGWDGIAQSAQAASSSRQILGCTGESIAAGKHEIEAGPALSLWSAVLPDAKIETFHVEFEQTPDGPICGGLPEPAADSADVRAVLLLADPYSCAIDTLISRLATICRAFL
jgi:small ligand-binding sensory domain FIST